jgi:hypothetical protein
MYAEATEARHGNLWNQALRFLRLFPADARVHAASEPHPSTTEGPCEVVNGRRGRTQLIKNYMLEDWQPRADADTAFRASNLAFFTDMATPYTQEYAYMVFRTYATQMGAENYILVEIMLTAVFWAMYPMRMRKRRRSSAGERTPQKRRRTTPLRGNEDTDE